MREGDCGIISSKTFRDIFYGTPIRGKTVVKQCEHVKHELAETVTLRVYVVWRGKSPGFDSREIFMWPFFSLVNLLLSMCVCMTIVLYYY